MSPVCAQVYEPGWLVRSNGDTLRGEIENSFWREPPTAVRFRPAPTSSSQLFQSRQVRGFGLRGGRYFRREALPIDYAADMRVAYAPDRTTTDIRTDSLLAEVLVDGPATLWRVTLPGTTHFLLRRPGRPVLDMSEHRYRQQSSGGSFAVINGNDYRNQLPVYVSDCPAASQAAQTARFTPEGLAAVAEAYNTACGSGQPSHRYLSATTEARHTALLGGVLAGARYNRFTEQGFNTLFCVDCETHPFGGLYVELLLPSRRAAAYGEISAGTFRDTGLQGWVGTARLGIRFFARLSQEQQLLFGLGYELNRIMKAEQLTNGQPSGSLNTDLLRFRPTTLVPGLSIGWRRQRVTVALDGQLYRRDASSATSALIGTDYSLRLGLAYRLGRHPDQISRKPSQP